MKRIMLVALNHVAVVDRWRFVVDEIRVEATLVQTFLLFQILARYSLLLVSIVVLAELSIRARPIFQDLSDNVCKISRSFVICKLGYY